MAELRLYSAEEGLDSKGYPLAWAEIKHEVRAAAGNRCIRCGHPYEKGAGEWSPCDERCTHQGPARYRPGWCEYGEGMDDGEVDPWSSDTATPPDATAGDLIEGAIDIEAHWRILTVHHLDGEKLNCRWWNLLSLCQRCHLEIQGRVRLERVWGWEHSDWFKPYVAGYYALTYLGEELNRGEAEERLDELLGLELARG